MIILSDLQLQSNNPFLKWVWKEEHQRQKARRTANSTEEDIEIIQGISERFVEF
jgi:hypothetical protein